MLFEFSELTESLTVAGGLEKGVAGRSTEFRSTGSRGNGDDVLAPSSE